MEMYEMFIDDENLTGVNALSIVKSPAIMTDFVALSSKTQPVMLAKVDEDKQILMGPALIPDKPIKRMKDGKEFYIYFSKDTIQKTAVNFFKNNKQNNATLEHDKSLEGMTIFESWIVEDSKTDKAAKNGLDVPEGTWMVSMKVDDKNIWDNYVKNDKVFGFSIEGNFANRLVSGVNMSAVEPEDDYLGETLELVRTYLRGALNA